MLLLSCPILMMICPPVLRRQLYTAITEDAGYASSVLDLLLAMLLSAAGPLWQQMQQAQAPAER